MATAPTLNPAARGDGIVYGTSVPLTATEATLGDAAKTPDPVAVDYGQTVVAVVKLVVNGIIVGNNTYVVMQTDMADGTWVDVAWIGWTGNQGSAVFVLCGGGVGAMNNAFQQSRQAGANPSSANGSNAVPLGGRVRFVGKATPVGGSSSLAGTTAGVLATVTYRLQGPR